MFSNLDGHHLAENILLRDWRDLVSQKFVDNKSTSVFVLVCFLPGLKLLPEPAMMDIYDVI